MLLISQPYFSTEKSIVEFLPLPPHKPQIIQIMDTHIVPTILDYSFSEVEEGLSYEGQSLYGIILVVHLEYAQKMTYMSNDASETIHSAHYSSLRSISIHLPKYVKNINIATLLKSGSLTIHPSVESVIPKILNSRSIQQFSLLKVSVILK